MTSPSPARWTPISSGLPIGLALGLAIWLLSAPLTGNREPWDTAGMAYAGALLLAGGIGGFLVPGHWIEVAIGIFSGQAVVLVAGVLAEPASGGLWPLGIFFLAIYSLFALLGGAVGSGLRRFMREVGTPGG
jgi:hypothetical protein